VWVGRAGGARTPPSVEGVEVHVIGDASGSGGLAPALSAAAELAARL
jgi:hypothetical protein